jgi:hypothetical protein
MANYWLPYMAMFQLLLHLVERINEFSKKSSEDAQLFSCCAYCMLSIFKWSLLHIFYDSVLLGCLLAAFLADQYLVLTL